MYMCIYNIGKINSYVNLDIYTHRRVLYNISVRRKSHTVYESVTIEC